MNINFLFTFLFVHSLSEELWSTTNALLFTGRCLLVNSLWLCSGVLPQSRRDRSLMTDQCPCYVLSMYNCRHMYVYQTNNTHSTWISRVYFVQKNHTRYQIHNSFKLHCENENLKAWLYFYHSASVFYEWPLMSNATLPQNYQSWPGGAVACNLETRRGSFGDSEVNPITNQPRNFYGSLDLVEKFIIL